MVAGGLELAVVGALLLLAVDRNFRTVQVQHDPLRRFVRLGPANQVPINRLQASPGPLLHPQFGFETMQRRTQRRSSHLSAGRQAAGVVLFDPIFQGLVILT